jgi:hypothetical protein
LYLMSFFQESFLSYNFYNLLIFHGIYKWQGIESWMWWIIVCNWEN